MRSAPFRHRQSTLPLLFAATFIAAPVHALTLGELRVQSYIGQPLNATVIYQLSADEAHPEIRCLTFSLPDNGLPGPSRPVLQLVEAERAIRILSVDAINEPIIGFTLQSTCNSLNFSRSYTGFLDMEPAVVAPVIAEPVTTITPPVQELLPQAEQEMLPPLKPVPVLRWPRRIVAENNSTLIDLVSLYYPPDSKRHRRLLNALIAANPDKIAADGTVLAGTSLRSSIPASLKPAVKPIKSGVDRLTILPEEPESARRKLPETKKVEDPLLALQSKVDTLADLQLKMETEITQLRQSLSQLEKPVASTVANIASASASSPAALLATKASTLVSAGISSVPTRADAKAIAPKPDLTARLAKVPFWLWLAGGLCAVAGFSFWLGRRGQRASGYVVRQGSNAAFFSPESSTPFPPHAIAREPVSEMSIIQRDPQGGFVVEEDESDIDRAQFLLADGEVEEAIALLYKSIEENEHDVERWLILFHIFRERMMKNEYAQLAMRFHDLPPDEEDWELVSNLGRKIDHDNALYARHPAEGDTTIATGHTQKAEDPVLDFLSAAAIAAAAAPPQEIKLDLPILDPAAPLSFIEPATSPEPPVLPDEGEKPDDKNDDFAKPCRY